MSNQGGGIQEIGIKEEMGGPGGAMFMRSLFYTKSAPVTSPLRFDINTNPYGFIDGQIYNVNMQEYKPDGSKYSDEAYTYNFTYVVPDAPTIDSVTASSGQAIINFTGTNSGSDITGYQYSIDNGSTWTPTILTTSTSIITMTSATSGSIKVTNLTNGTPYNFGIKAVNAIGASTPSNIVFAVPGVPGAPTISTVTVSSGQAIINFIPGPSNGSPIIGYQYSTNNGFTWTPTILTISTSIITMTSATSGSIKVTNLTNGTPYYLLIKAVNANGASTPSFAVQPVTPYSVPDAPTITNITISNGQAIIDFTPGPSNGSPIRNYEYRIDGVSNGAWYPAFTQTNTGEIYTISSPIITQDLGLSNRISYTFILRAISGPSRQSDSSASFTTSSRLTLSQLKAENANKETYIENGYGLLEMTNSNEFDAKYLASTGFSLTELIPHFTPKQLIETRNFGGKELKKAGLIKNGIQFNTIMINNKKTNSIEFVNFYFLKNENIQTNNRLMLSNGKLTTVQEKSTPTT